MIWVTFEMSILVLELVRFILLPNLPETKAIKGITVNDNTARFGFLYKQRSSAKTVVEYTKKFFVVLAIKLSRTLTSFITRDMTEPLDSLA
jgi:hypothetical protein